MKIMDNMSKVVGVVFVLLIVSVLVYFGSDFSNQTDFKITNERYYTDLGKTVMDITYLGSAPVNVSVDIEFDVEGHKMNTTINYCVMNNGDVHTLNSFGYGTWCEIIYNGNKMRINFNPKQTTTSESE